MSTDRSAIQEVAQTVMTALPVTFGLLLLSGATLWELAVLYNSADGEAR